MMEYMYDHAIIFAIFIIGSIVVWLLYMALISVPRTMVAKVCDENGNGFKTKSIYIWLPLYFFFLISSAIEIWYLFGMKGHTYFYPHIVWIECIGVPVCLLLGYLLAYYKGGFYKVKGKDLYIKKYNCQETRISVLELKKYAQQKAPQYENGEVKFYYRDSFLVIPVSKCVGGYDFVNRLCDKMGISRIYMEDIL